MSAAARRVYLLTGASGRLGQAICRSAGPEAVILAQYRTRPVEVSGGAGGGPVIVPIRADLALEGAAEALVDAALSQVGAIDCLINAAAHWQRAPITRPGFVREMTLHHELNAVVPVRLTLAVLERSWRMSFPSTNRARGRNVVNVSSTSGSHVYPGRGQGAYGPSKAALEAITRHMASELAELGIRVNAVAPNRFPHVVSTERVVGAIEELSRAATSVTGEIVILDNGR